MDLHEIPVVRAFMRNEGAEQIDGAFKLEGRHYIVEYRWSENVPPLLGQDPTKSLFLRDGYVLRCVHALEGDLRELLLAKLARLNPEAEPFLSVKAYLGSA